MAKKPAAPKAPPIDGDPHNSFDDTSYGIGQNADGTFNSFPVAELAARTAARDAAEAAQAYAVEQSEKGFPDQDGGSDSR